MQRYDLKDFLFRKIAAAFYIDIIIYIRKFAQHNTSHTILKLITLLFKQKTNKHKSRHNEIHQKIRKEKTAEDT